MKNSKMLVFAAILAGISSIVIAESNDNKIEELGNGLITIAMHCREYTSHPEIGDYTEIGDYKKKLNHTSETMTASQILAALNFKENLALELALVRRCDECDACDIFAQELRDKTKRFDILVNQLAAGNMTMTEINNNDLQRKLDEIMKNQDQQ